MYKIITTAFALSSILFAQEPIVKVDDPELLNIIESLPIKPDERILEDFGFEKKETTLSRKDSIKEQYKKFQFAIEQISDPAFKQLAKDNYTKGMEYLENIDNMTIFYFASQDAPDESIRSFMTQIDVLNSHYPNIKGKIMLNNYPDNLVDRIDKELGAKVVPFEKESGKGTLKLRENGSYTYKVKETTGMLAGDKYQDVFPFEKLDGTTDTIRVDLKVDKKTNLKIKGSTIVDSMVPYLTNLRDKKIGSNNVKIHVHPWAYKSLKLSVVPAYVLGYCDPNDFKFRDCENKFIVKGNVTVEHFMNLVSEKDKEYIKYYDVFKEGTK